MAHNHLPAVLRRRRHLLRLRHGADARHPHPQDLRPGRFHHRAPPAEFREGHAGDGTDCRLRLRYRGIHGLVQRRSLRRLHALESPPRPLCSPLLDAVDLQHLYSAGALDSQDAHESRCTVFRLRRDSRRHVARALHHRSRQSAARLPHVLVGHVLPHALGLDDLHRHHRHVPGRNVPVPAAAACDFHLRDAHPFAGSGGLTAYIMQYWMSAVDYPLNIGGKPPHSWPAFIVITFEMTILFAGISAVFGMLALNGMPMPYHPVFNVPRFALASKDRFFLIVFSTDKKYDPADTRKFLEGLAPRSVSEVPS